MSDIEKTIADLSAEYERNGCGFLRYVSTRPAAATFTPHDFHLAWAALHEQSFGPRRGWDDK